MREVAEQVVDQTHMVIGVMPSKLYPVATKDLVIGQVNSNA